MSCVVVSAMARGQLPSGDGGDGRGDGNHFGRLILIPPCMQIRALGPILDSLAVGRAGWLCAAACPPCPAGALLPSALPRT